LKYNTWSSQVLVFGQTENDVHVLHKPAKLRNWAIEVSPYSIIVDTQKDGLKIAIAQLVNMVQIKWIYSFLETEYELPATIVLCENLDTLYYADKLIQIHNKSLEVNIFELV
jgi:hypothetical protein